MNGIMVLPEAQSTHDIQSYTLQFATQPKIFSRFFIPTPSVSIPNEYNDHVLGRGSSIIYQKVSSRVWLCQSFYPFGIGSHGGATTEYDFLQRKGIATEIHMCILQHLHEILPLGSSLIYNYLSELMRQNLYNNGIPIGKAVEVSELIDMAIEHQRCRSLEIIRDSSDIINTDPFQDPEGFLSWSKRILSLALRINWQIQNIRQRSQLPDFELRNILCPILNFDQRIEKEPDLVAQEPYMARSMISSIHRLIDHFMKYYSVPLQQWEDPSVPLLTSFLATCSR